ncbi:hypothetical protein GW17_00010684 [Ensete ventricosum]|nr:hypothetical protein GW17_00010684 [Ensete ventricosum]
MREVGLAQVEEKSRVGPAWPEVRRFGLLRQRSIVFFFLHHHVNHTILLLQKKMASFSGASPSSAPPPPTAADPPSWLNRGRGPVLYPLFAVICVVVILLLCHYICRIICSWKSLRLNETSTAGPPPGVSSARNARLSPATLASLPIFVFSLDGDEKKLECSVCLAEFRQGERGRLLPRCNHRFHADCVDTWLQSHSTCPICRSAIETTPPDSDDAARSISSPL